MQFTGTQPNRQFAADLPVCSLKRLVAGSDAIGVGGTRRAHLRFAEVVGSTAGPAALVPLRVANRKSSWQIAC